MQPSAAQSADDSSGVTAFPGGHFRDLNGAALAELVCRASCRPPGLLAGSGARRRNYRDCLGVESGRHGRADRIRSAFDRAALADTARGALRLASLPVHALGAARACRGLLAPCRDASVGRNRGQSGRRCRDSACPLGRVGQLCAACAAPGLAQTWPVATPLQAGSDLKGRPISSIMSLRRQGGYAGDTEPDGMESQCGESFSSSRVD